MKISDKKQLTSYGNYQIDVDLGELPHTIGRYQKNYHLDINPDFQRGHVWTEKQQILFCEFILLGGRTNPICLNHTSWQGFKTSGDMVCVDGLQRLTALTKMLNDEIKVFGFKFSDYEDYKIIKRTKSIQININNLETRKEVLQWYIDINSGGTIHTEDDINKVQNLLDSTKGEKK